MKTTSSGGVELGVFHVDFCPVITRVAPLKIELSCDAKLQSGSEHVQRYLHTRSDFLIRLPSPHYSTWVAASTSSFNLRVRHRAGRCCHVFCSATFYGSHWILTSWPPRSPVFISLDLFFWGYVGLKNKMYSSKVTSLQQLKDRISEDTSAAIPDTSQGMWQYQN